MVIGSNFYFSPWRANCPSTILPSMIGSVISDKANLPYIPFHWSIPGLVPHNFNYYSFMVGLNSKASPFFFITRILQKVGVGIEHTTDVHNGSQGPSVWGLMFHPLSQTSEGLTGMVMGHSPSLSHHSRKARIRAFPWHNIYSSINKGATVDKVASACSCNSSYCAADHSIILCFSGFFT